MYWSIAARPSTYKKHGKKSLIQLGITRSGRLQDQKLSRHGVRSSREFGGSAHYVETRYTVLYDICTQNALIILRNCLT